MSLWTLLKRAWYVFAYNGKFSFTPIEKALIDAVVAKLPPEEADVLRAQAKSFDYLGRLHKGRVLNVWNRGYTGSLLGEKENETQCCVARVKFRTGGKSMLANVISIRGVFGMLQFRREPPTGGPVTVEEITLYPGKYVDIEEAVHRREHGRDGV